MDEEREEEEEEEKPCHLSLPRPCPSLVPVINGKTSRLPPLLPLLFIKLHRK